MATMLISGIPRCTRVSNLVILRHVSTQSRILRAKKAALTMVCRLTLTPFRFPATVIQTPSAVAKLGTLLQGPNPQLIRIGVRNKGCAGLSYHLEYVEKPDGFDEVVEQDGVQVLVDSKALFSIIGSEMDWREDSLRYVYVVCLPAFLPFSLLSARFAFKNPNIKDACGCGESFTVGS